MPRLTVWMIRASLGYFAVGFTLGGLLLFHKGVPLGGAYSPGLGYWLWRLLPVHIEFLLIGWIVQLVMGMAYWILPRFRRAPRRGSLQLAGLAFGLINVGVVLVGVAPLVSQGAVLQFAGRAAEVAASLAFALHAWPRVKAAGAG